MLPILGATLAQQLGEAAVGAQASWRTDCALLGHDGRFALRDHAEEGAQSASSWTASLQLERWQEGALVELGFRDETRVDRVTHAEIVRHSPLSVVLRLQGTPGFFGHLFVGDGQWWGEGEDGSIGDFKA